MYGKNICVRKDAIKRKFASYETEHIYESIERRGDK